MSGPLVPDLDVAVNGRSLKASADVRRDLIEVTVQDDLDMSSVFTLKLHCWDDNKRLVTWADSDRFALGRRVDISFGYVGAPLLPVVSGEITDLSVDFGAARAPVLTVTGRDYRHRLGRSKQSHPYEKMTNSQIASQVVQRNGLTPVVAPAGELPKDEELQSDETDLEFLTRLAGEKGYELLVEQRSVYFGPPRDTADVPIVLAVDNDQVTDFSASVSGATPVNAVQVSGTNAFEEPFVETLTLVELPGVLPIDELDWRKVVCSEKPVSDASEALDVARAELDNYASRYLTGSGTCRGNPRLRAGKRVQLVGLGHRLSRVYRLTSVSHSFSTTGLYTTSFQVNGAPKPDAYATSPDGFEQSPVARRKPFYGVVSAVVTDINDPQNQGRVRVRFPWNADAGVSKWAPVATPMSGAGWGQFFLPQVNDEVLVMFERGELNLPYVMGSLFNARNLPPPTEGRKTGDVRVIQSRSGHTITLDDTPNDARITITDGQGNQVVITPGTKTIELTADNVTVKASKQLTLDGGAVSVSCTDFSLEASGDFKVSADGRAALSAQADVAVDGQSVNLNQGALEVLS